MNLFADLFDRLRGRPSASVQRAAAPAAADRTSTLSGPRSATAPAEQPAFVWSVVATMQGRLGIESGAAGGTVHFRPGAKLYCLPALWGDGYEQIKVTGHHRGSHRYVTMVLPSRLLTNWRVERVYSPHVIRTFDGRWDASELSKQTAEAIVRSMQDGDQ